MRLIRMRVSGFRAFATETELDLDADVIVLSGFNGTGKTSFFDAILWGLTGSVDRIGPKASVINKFADLGYARVEMDLRLHEDRELVVSRRLSGMESPTETLIVTLNGTSEKGAAAQALLLSELAADSDNADTSFESLSSWLTKSVYLEQDRVRAFVEASNEQQRFEIVSELVGASSLSRLNRELDNARRAWTAATNRTKDEILSVRHTRSGLMKRLNDIDSAIDEDEIRRACATWSSAASQAVRRGEVQTLAKSASVSVWAPAIDRGVGQVSAELRSLEGLASDITRMRQTQSQTLPKADDPGEVRARVEELQQKVAQATSEVKEAEEAVSAARRRRLAESEASRSLASMAQLALRHLGELCPVCNQQHDSQATERRLRALVEQGDLPADVSEEQELARAADNRRNLESRLAAESQRLDSSESALRQLEERRARLESSAESLGLVQQLSIKEFPAWLASLESEIHERSAELRTLREDGMRVSAAVARAIEAGEAARLRQQITDLTETIEKQESECALRDEAYDDAQALHEAIRDLEDSFVDDELVRIEDLLQAIYAAVDPHPEFKAVQFLTRRHRGRGKLWTKLEATANGNPVVVEEPKTVLSSSQLNVLAVATFMALNLSVKDLPVEILALDDPLQSLDDVNLLGLTDLLRRLRGRRQLIISTHDDRLASLLQRKLRPLQESERTMSLWLDAWDRSGPVVVAREVPRDDRDLRLAVA